MKVAILSESPPDESAIVILVEAVLGSSVDRVAVRRFGREAGRQCDRYCPA
jgi:hypothetical protein